MSEDRMILLHCIHNALWMTEHEAQMRAVDEHIAVLSPSQKDRAKEMLRELVKQP